MKRERPGQIRVRRDFLKTRGVAELWPEGVVVRHVGEMVEWKGVR